MHCLMHCLMHWLDALLDSRSTRFPFTSTPSPPAPLAIRKAPSASVESIEPRPPRPCEVGRPKGRRRKHRRQSHNFFLAPAAPGTPTRRQALGTLPTPPPRPENLLSDCTENCPLRPLRAPRRFRNPKIGQQLGAQPTPRFRVMIDALLDALLDALARCTARLPLDEVPVHVHPFAARAPCDSKGSECQCGIHRAEAASALRSRKTERAAKEKPTPISHIFFSTFFAWHPNSPPGPGEAPHPAPSARKSVIRLHKKLPSVPLRAPRRFRNPKIGQQLGAQPTPRFRWKV